MAAFAREVRQNGDVGTSKFESGASVLSERQDNLGVMVFAVRGSGFDVRASVWDVQFPISEF